MLNSLKTRRTFLANATVIAALGASTSRLFGDETTAPISEDAIKHAERWYSNGSNCNGADPMNDVMEVEFSSDDGLTWMNLETVGPDGPEVSGGWFDKEFDLSTVAGFVPTNQFQIRFIVGDLNDGSVIEAGIDGLLLSGAYCDTTECASDLSGDGTVNVTDLLSLIDAWGPCPGECDADFDNNGTVDIVDLLTLIGDWGVCE